MKHLWPWLLALVSGVCMAVTFPPFEFDGLAWFALAPLAAAVWFSPDTGRLRWLRLLGLGYTCGLAFFLIVFFWITEVTLPGWLLLGMYLAIYPALWALFAGTVGRPRETGGDLSVWTNSFNNLRLACRCAAAWVGLEWVRGTLFTGFGWNQLGVSQWQNVSIIQIADFAGVGGVTFLIVLMNLIVVMTVKRFSLEAGRGRLRPHYDFTITLALVALAFLYGTSKFRESDDGQVPLRVAAVQANIPQYQKWDAEFEQHIVETYRRLTDNAIALQPDLLVWPEAATPFPLMQHEGVQREVAGILEQLKAGFLLGTLNRLAVGDFNAAVLLHANGQYQVYHKMHLVPFGEYVPLRDVFPLFAWAVGDQVPSDFDAGEEPVVMETKPRPVPMTVDFPPFPKWSALFPELKAERDPVRLAPLICFEDTVGEVVRQFSGRGAQLLVTLTNDGWFRESAGSRQHLSNAIFSAVMTKLPLVRAANTGVTCFIDARGRVLQQLQSEKGSTFIEGVLFGEISVPASPRRTFYTTYGDLFSIACLIAALLSIRTCWLEPLRRHTTEN